MTINEYINSLPFDKYGDVDVPQAILFACELDGKIFREIIETHEGAEVTELPFYDELTDRNTVLLVPEPWSGIYKLYAQARISLLLDEGSRYNTEISVFRDAYKDFARHYNRTHMPIQRKVKF